MLYINTIKNDQKIGKFFERDGTAGEKEAQKYKENKDIQAKNGKLIEETVRNMMTNGSPDIKKDLSIVIQEIKDSKAIVSRETKQALLVLKEFKDLGETDKKVIADMKTYESDVATTINNQVSINQPKNEYKIARGDTFIDIANRFGISKDVLQKLNPKITDINDIKIGQSINTPEGSNGITVLTAKDLRREEAKQDAKLSLKEREAKRRLRNSDPTPVASLPTDTSKNLESINRTKAEITLEANKGTFLENVMSGKTKGPFRIEKNSESFSIVDINNKPVKIPTTLTVDLNTLVSDMNKIHRKNLKAAQEASQNQQDQFISGTSFIGA